MAALAWLRWLSPFGRTEMTTIAAALAAGGAVAYRRRDLRG